MSERQQVLKNFEEQKDYLDQKISYGIENYRKGDAKITLKDGDGSAADGAKIKITQKTHHFKFGANLFLLDELESDEKNNTYKKYFADVFNMATLPFYWNDLEPVCGKPRFDKNSPKVYRRPALDLCVEFCRKNGIEPREHCLNYDLFRPQWLYGASVDVIKQKLEERIKILAERYRDDIPCWEVTNETLCILPEGKASAFYYEPDFVEWSFETAQKYLGDNQLAINESPWWVYDKAFLYNRSPYYMLIDRAIKNGARIDAIGMQFHMYFTREEEVQKVTKYFYNPRHHYELMDTYAGFGKPLQLTEITIPAYSNDPEDEELQAQILEKLYSIWFSHPATEQIIYWNLVDGYAFVPNPDPEKIRRSQGDMTLGENYYYGGLVRFDMTPKPAYYAIKNLINNVWRTRGELCTDDGGTATMRGFYGRYEVEIERRGKRTITELELLPGGKNEFEIEV